MTIQALQPSLSIQKNTLRYSKSNKKYKGIKKDSSEIGFENFTNRIKSLVNFDTFKKPPAKYKEVSRFTVFQG